MSIDSKLRRGFKVFTLFVNSLNTAVFNNYKTLSLRANQCTKKIRGKAQKKKKEKKKTGKPKEVVLFLVQKLS